MRIRLGDLRQLDGEAAAAAQPLAELVSGWFERHDDVLAAFDGWRYPQGHRTMSYEEIRQLDPQDLDYVIGLKLRDMVRARSGAEAAGEPVDSYDGYVDGLRAALDDLRDLVERRRGSLE